MEAHFKCDSVEEEIIQWQNWFEVCILKFFISIIQLIFIKFTETSLQYCIHYILTIRYIVYDIHKIYYKIHFVRLCLKEQQMKSYLWSGFTWNTNTWKPIKQMV